MTQLFISPNDEGRGKAHLAEQREFRGTRTGRVIDTYYVARCSGRSIGGAWGYAITSYEPQDRLFCRRCERLRQSSSSQEQINEPLHS
jgi:hypothetical protein